MKTILPVSIALMLALFFIAWTVYPPIEGFLIHLFLQFVHSSQIVATTTTEKLNILIKTSVSFALIPAVSLGSMLLNQKYKSVPYSLGKYLKETSFVLGAYLVGFFYKAMYLKDIFQLADAVKIAPEIVNQIGMQSVVFYDYGIFCSLIMGIVLILTKKKKEVVF